MAGAAAVIAYGLFLSWAVRTDRLPLQAVSVPLVLSVITFVAYALDKHAAQTGRRRTPESTLHLLELAGGWPGAWIAQQRLRHKSRKPAYRRAFRAMAMLHCMTLAAWWWTHG